MTMTLMIMKQVWYCCSSGTLDWLLQRSAHLTQLDLSWYLSLHSYPHNHVILLIILITIIREISPNLTSPSTYHCCPHNRIDHHSHHDHLIIMYIEKVIIIIRVTLILMTSLGAATMADLPQLLLFFLMIIAIIVILIMIILIIQIMIILIPPGVATMVDSLQLLFHRSWPQLDLR